MNAVHAKPRGRSANQRASRVSPHRHLRGSSTTALLETVHIGRVSQSRHPRHKASCQARRGQCVRRWQRWAVAWPYVLAIGPPLRADLLNLSQRSRRGPQRRAGIRARRLCLDAAILRAPNQTAPHGARLPPSCLPGPCGKWTEDAICLTARDVQLPEPRGLYKGAVPLGIRVNASLSIPLSRI